MLPPLVRIVRIVSHGDVDGDFVNLHLASGYRGNLAEVSPDDEVSRMVYTIRGEPVEFAFDLAGDDFAIKGHATRSKDLVAVINAAIAETTSWRTM